MNRIAALAMFGLMLSGCGPSHADRAARFIADLKTSPAIAIEAKFGEQTYQGELSKAGLEKLCQLVAAAEADHDPMKYAMLGTISYQTSGKANEEALLLNISPNEAGLRIDGDTYLRKINTKDLHAVCSELITMKRLND